MCYCDNIDNASRKLLIQSIEHSRNENQEKVYYVKAIYDQTPETLSGRVVLFFQRIELIEKIAEIADETFHLLGPVFQRNTSLAVYQTLRNLHHAAHDIEHVLHNFCFLGDMTRIITSLLTKSDKFFEYYDKEHTQFDYLRSTARVCHVISHFLATASFLSELKLYQFIRLEKVFKYAPVFGALGFAIWTISLIWRRHQNIDNDQFASDLGVHLAGCLFEAIPLAKTVASLAPHVYVINKFAAVAGIIHAWSVMQRLMPKDRVEVIGEYIKPSNPEVTSNGHCVHKHLHGHKH